MRTSCHSGLLMRARLVCTVDSSYTCKACMLHACMRMCKQQHNTCAMHTQHYLYMHSRLWRSSHGQAQVPSPATTAMYTCHGATRDHQFTKVCFLSQDHALQARIRLLISHMHHTTAGSPRNTSAVSVNHRLNCHRHLRQLRTCHVCADVHAMNYNVALCFLFRIW